MLTDDVARELTDQTNGEDALLPQLILQKGLLSPVQIDIVQTLLHPDEIIPGYEIENVIGQGGMGVVYRARQKNLDRVVALKTILLSQLSDQSTVARFEQEARTVARLQHPNIIAAYDFGRHEGRLYFAMELIEGRDLEQLIRSHNQLDEAAAWGIARQIASGLSHAAKEQVVHRDIKPANILLVAPPEGFPVPKGLPMVKIADFGLAFLTKDIELNTRLTSTNSTVGSPHYMAPEQMSDEPIDYRADIYALGATVFHMLTGKLPFSGSVTQIFADKIRGTIPNVREHYPEVSQQSCALVDSMLASKRDERLSDYSEVLKRIDEVIGNFSQERTSVSILGDEEKQGQSGSLAPTQEFSKVDTKRSVQHRKQSRAIARIIGSIALLCLFAFGAWWFRSNDAPRPAPDMQPVGASKFLFTGSLEEWLSFTGLWRDTKTEDGSVIISGKDGVIRRELLRGSHADAKPIPFYELNFNVWLKDATAIEVQFGIEATGELDSRRSLLRLTLNSAMLAYRDCDNCELKESSQQLIGKFPPDRPHAIRLERRAFLWRAYVNDELIGTLPVERKPQLAEIRLAVEDGPAWFADIEVQEMRPVDQPKSE